MAAYTNLDTICLTDMLPQFTVVDEEAKKTWDYMVANSQTGRAYMIVKVAAELASTAEYRMTEVNNVSIEIGVKSSGFRELTLANQVEIIKLLCKVWKHGETLRRWWNLQLQPWYNKSRGHEANKRESIIINPCATLVLKKGPDMFHTLVHVLLVLSALALVGISIHLYMNFQLTSAAITLSLGLILFCVERRVKE